VIVKPVHLFALGVLLQITGCALPFLMVIQALDSTFFLNFFAWGASVTGMALGFIGLANYARFGRGR
jgi:hypothetical protein